MHDKELFGVKLLMKVAIEKMTDGKEELNPNVAVGNSVVENCRCIELEERSKIAEVRCAELEFELQKKNDQCEALMAKLVALEVEKVAVEDELKVLRVCSEGLQCKKEAVNGKEGEIEGIVDLTHDNQVSQLMTENTVLECEKKKAESEVEVWKKKYKKLELMFELRSGGHYYEENGKNKDNNQIKNEGCWLLGANLDSKVHPFKKFRKQLTFEIEDNPRKKMAPYTPLKSVIDINDNDDEPNISQHPVLDSKGTESIVVASTSFGEENGKLSSGGHAQNNEEDLKFGEDVPFVAMPKRKRNCYVVTSESELDVDNEPNISLHPVLDSKGSKNIVVSTSFAGENGNISSNSHAQNNKEDLNFGEDVHFVAMPKRKRTCNVVTSESEPDDDDDDNVPLSQLFRMHIPKVSPDQVRCDISSSLSAATSSDDNVIGTIKRRRQLVPLRKCARESHKGKKSTHRSNTAKHHPENVPTYAAAASESEEDLSDSEDEDLSDFIVDDFDVSNFDNTSSSSQDIPDELVDSDYSSSQDVADNDKDSDSQDASDEDMDYGKILSQIQRKKDHTMKWEFEAEMLAEFGKDPELCMKAVCVLYRQQTSDEQTIKGALYHNGRGFNRLDAHRGSALAEFLTDGDPYSGLKKTVEELHEYDPQAVELCRTLACRYSKQLYEIYKNKEDRFFP